MFALALVLSVVGLALGPLLVAAGRGSSLVRAAVEGLTLGLVPLLIVLRLVPHVMEELGPLALGIVAAGYGGLWLIDRKRHDLGDRVGYAVLIPSLAVHALADGAGLGIAFAASREQGAAGMLIGLAIVVHRLPEGLLIATRFVPIIGWRRTLAWLALLAGATLVGALAGSAVLEHVPDAIFDAVVAVGLGAMLRMVAHLHGPPMTSRGARAAGGLAFLAGVIAAIAIPSHESVLELAQPGELPMASTVLPLFTAIAPAALLGIAVGGLSRALAPVPAEVTLGRGSLLSRAVKGALLAAARQVPSQGAIRAFRTLGGGAWPEAEGAPGADGAQADRRAPRGAAVSFLVGALGLHLGGVAVTFALLGAPFAAACAAAVAGMAVVLAVVVERVSLSERVPGAACALRSASGHGSGHGSGSGSEGAAREDHRRARPFASRVWRSIKSAIDHDGPWYVAGVILAGVLEAAIAPGAGESPLAPAGAALGVVLGASARIPAHGAAPLVAVLIHKGFSVGIALVLLIAAICPGLVLAPVVARRLGRRAGAAFAVGSLVCALIAGALADARVSPRSSPDLHDLAAAARGPFAWACAVLFALLLAGSVVRLGPREWLGRISSRP